MSFNKVIPASEMQNDCEEISLIAAENHETISGKRIVEISYFVNELQSLNVHSPFGCTLSDMEIVSENRCGLVSNFKFKCKMCNYTKVISTGKNDNVMSSNTAAVMGITKIGCGYTNMEEFFSTLNMPCMSNNTFLREQDRISESWEKTAIEEMELAAIEERTLAIERGDVDAEGIPLLTVVVDGSWAKRSYRTNYSSLSGVVSFVSCNIYYIYFPFKYKELTKLYFLLLHPQNILIYSHAPETI